MARFAVIDFETANGQRSSGCSGGLVLVENGEFTSSIYSLIRPRPDFYTRRTTSIHGLSSADTLNADDFPVVWEGIAPQLEGMPLVAHNSPFDEGCLKAVHSLYGMSYPDYTFYCTCRLSRRQYPSLVNHQLHTVSAHCGYNLANHHHALADAEACAKIALKLMEEKGVSRLCDLLTR